jgi:cholesterol transport system auxiliary component
VILSNLRRAPIVLLAAPLAACVSVFPTTKPAALYSFGLAEGPSTPPSTGARGVVLEPLTFPREATTDGILTVEGPEISYLADARWTTAAPVLFRQAMNHAFDASAAGARLMNRGEVGPAAALLQVEVVRFQAEYAAPKSPPVAHVTLRITLSRPNGTRIDAAVYDVQKPAAENRVAAIVAAYDSATGEALTDLARWVDQKTQALPAPTP